MNYYYLISSLPRIEVDYDSNVSLNFIELYDLIERNLTTEDRKTYHALLYQNDNRNLLNLIFHEYHDLEYKYVYEPTVIPYKTLQGYRRNLSGLPDYMIFFLQDNAGIFSSYSLTDIELKLRKYFMEYVRSLNSDFLIQYYEWQYRLEEILSDINRRKHTFLNPRGIHDIDYLGDSPTIHQVDKKQLTGDLTPLIEEEDYTAIEKVVDQYYWDFADSWTDIFSSNAVFSYVVKLLRLSRWSGIPTDPDEVEDQFLQLLYEFKTKTRSPKMSVI